MKHLFSIMLLLFTSQISKVKDYTWDKFTVFDISRILRQYVTIFNTLLINRKDKILIIAPNSSSWVFLVLASMAKRLDIYIVSPRESLLNVKNIIFTYNISHIFTTNDWGVRLKEDGISRLISVKSITAIGIIYHNTLVDTNVLFFSNYYSTWDSTDLENTRIERIQIVPQLQEMDEEKLIDWASKLSTETQLYRINVFTEGVTRSFPKLVRFDGAVFEKNIQKVEDHFLNSGCESVNLSLDYAEWVPLVLAYFVNSFHITKKNADIVVFDNNTFLSWWRELVESQLQVKWLDWVVNQFPFMMTRLVKKTLRRELGSFKHLYILNGGKLPVHIKNVLVRTKLPVHTTFGTLETGYVSFLNTGKEVLTDLATPITESGGHVELVYEQPRHFNNTYKNFDQSGQSPYRIFHIESSTDAICTSANNHKGDYDVMYMKTTVRPKILWFPQKARVIKRYAGRYLDTVMVYDKTFIPIPMTHISSFFNSIRLFNGSIVKTVGQDTMSKNAGLSIGLEVNKREQELLDLEGERLDKHVNGLLDQMNQHLPPSLKIKNFYLVKEGSFTRTRNNNVKSILYNP